MAAAAGLIGAGGADAATVRSIATSAGYSTKIVSHYFIDKRDLMLKTYRYCIERVIELNASLRANNPTGVRFFCISLLPRDDPELRAIWRTYVAFWHMALTDSDFADAQQRQILHARDALNHEFDQDPRFQGHSAQWREEHARDLVTLVMGISVQAVLDPRDWPEERQVKLIDDRLQLIAPAADLVARPASEVRQRALVPRRAAAPTRPLEATDVVSGLEAKRAELLGYREALQTEIVAVAGDIEHLEGALRLFDPSAASREKKSCP